MQTGEGSRVLGSSEPKDVPKVGITTMGITTCLPLRLFLSGNACLLGLFVPAFGPTIYMLLGTTITLLLVVLYTIYYIVL